MEKALQSFYQKCARYITGKHIRPDPKRYGMKTMDHPSAGVLEEIGLLSIQQYALKKHFTIQNLCTNLWANFTFKTIS
jgi:hypothetical protein